MKWLLRITAPLLILGVIIFAQPKHAYAATIALDATAGGTTTGSLSIAVTPTGTNICIVAGFEGDSTDTLTGMTANGKTMTIVQKQKNSTDLWGYIAVIANADQGTQNIVETGATSHNMWAVSYTGCGGLDSSNVFAPAATNNVNPCTTVVAANSWLVGQPFSGFIAGDPSAGTGTTLRGSALDQSRMGDSNGTVATGSQCLSFTYADATKSKMGDIVSLKPATAVTTIAFWQFADF